MSNAHRDRIRRAVAARESGRAKVRSATTAVTMASVVTAGALALALPEEYYRGLAAGYTARRDAILPMLERAGFRCFKPCGAYYVMTDISGFGFADDYAFVRHLIEDAGVAAVPGSSFFDHRGLGAQMVRFCFCKREETLEEARVRLRRKLG